MNWSRKLQVRIRALFQKRKLDAEMDEEMRSHIEMQTQENLDAGMSAEDARYAALRQFGWVESIKETCREHRGVSWIEHLIYSPAEFFSINFWSATCCSGVVTYGCS